jgi:hypothetical protein
MSTILEGSQGYAVFTLDVEVEQVTAHLVVNRTGAIIAKFNYPAREGYILLSKTDNVYRAIIPQSATIGLANEIMRLDFAAFMNGEIKAQGQNLVAPIKDTTTKTLGRV